MPFRLSPSAFAVAAAVSCFALPTYAQDAVNTPVLVSATRIEMQDTDAPYASEVHTRQKIEQSSAHSLFEYLAQHSSLQVTPHWGNRNAPNITMRGFGEDGHQNVVITVNGRRLNNIENVPALIGAISLGDIERIEITKGSGSVMYGDGATAGSIQIYTKAQNSASLDMYMGSHGQRGAIANVGMVQDKWDLSVSADHNDHNGFSQRDPSGHRDAHDANTWSASSRIQLHDKLQATVELGASRIDNRFPNYLSPQAFAANPAQSSGWPYPQVVADNRYWGLGLQYQLSDDLQISLRHHKDDKTNIYKTYGYSNDFVQTSNEVALQYQQGTWTINAGVQSDDGERISDAGNVTRKNNLGGFVHSQYLLDEWTFSAGLRRERIRYQHTELGQTDSRQKDYQTAWEWGANRRFNEQTSAFASYSQAFASPDIDRFFDYTTSQFTGFGQPTRSRTLTLGFNHATPHHRFKASVFYSKLHDEIYLNPFAISQNANANIDQSHKYGVEIQEQWQVSARQQVSVNYAWTRAVIDQEIHEGSNYSGKHTPGVPRHSVTLGWSLRVAAHGNLQLSHTWRSSHWALGNFSNEAAYRQAIYSATDVSYRHQVHPNVQLYAAVNNVFDHANSVAVKSYGYGLYPSNFERTWKLGARISF